jgi:hypothetical protein
VKHRSDGQIQYRAVAGMAGLETLSGIGCNGSTKGALKMTELGFRTKELIGGLDWWKRDDHPTSR